MDPADRETLPTLNSKLALHFHASLGLAKARGPATTNSGIVNTANLNLLLRWRERLRSLGPSPNEAQFLTFAPRIRIHHGPARHVEREAGRSGLSHLRGLAKADIADHPIRDDVSGRMPFDARDRPARLVARWIHAHFSQARARSARRFCASPRRFLSSRQTCRHRVAARRARPRARHRLAQARR